MGEPATEIDAMDSAKDSRGLDLGLKKAMASDLDGLRWRPLFKSQLWTLWVQDSIEATWSASMDKLVPIYSWVSSAYWWKDTMLLAFERSGFMTLATGDIKRTKSSGPRTEPWGYTRAYCCVGWGWRVNLNKGCAVSQVGSNPWDDIAGKTESMLKSVEKCGMVKSIECGGHVESSQNCDFSRVNSFHDVVREFEQSSLSRNGICGRQTAKGRNWEI